MDADVASQLADWRRQVGELYTRARSLGAGEGAWDEWREGKQRLYREHPQSPVRVDMRATYTFECFPYDASVRVLADLAPVTPRHIDGDSEVPGMTHVGTLRFTVERADHELGAYWLDGYAGGLFVPFADATSGVETYGGGRYVLDTAKGADLGTADERFLIDFNFAFAPSCAHDPAWRCPLAPPANRLPVAVRAGEMHR
ncbi:MAG: DUF1684 domain-containing protein [Candidatus Dormibacteraeota bacterium]|nr:DUF1684 domain-containing protein [Candidatus Dormibacteraeota bacterium]